MVEFGRFFRRNSSKPSPNRDLTSSPTSSQKFANFRSSGPNPDPIPELKCQPSLKPLVNARIRDAIGPKIRKDRPGFLHMTPPPRSQHPQGPSTVRLPDTYTHICLCLAAMNYMPWGGFQIIWLLRRNFIFYSLPVDPLSYSDASSCMKKMIKIRGGHDGNTIPGYMPHLIHPPRREMCKKMRNIVSELLWPPFCAKLLHFPFFAGKQHILKMIIVIFGHLQVKEHEFSISKCFFLQLAHKAPKGTDFTGQSHTQHVICIIVQTDTS